MGSQGGCSVGRILLVLGEGREIAVRVRSLMAGMAVKGCRVFELHVFTTRPRPDYMETVRHVILNNVAYSLRVWYHGTNIEKLKELMDYPNTGIVVDETADEKLKSAVMGRPAGVQRPGRGYCQRGCAWAASRL